MDDTGLLKPSLDGAQSQTIYSVGALIATAFFAGGSAVLVMAALNSHRLNRLSRDIVWILGGLLLCGALLWVGYLWADDARTMRIANRALGFLLAGGVYLVFRPYYRSMSVMGREPPSPYLKVVLALLAGTAFNVAVVALAVASGA